jgi:hypothetical protein
MTGILAVWNDCAPGNEADYERWYANEHLPERVGLPGFRRGWRYEAVSADLRYFTYYDVDTPDVLESPAYLARLRNPTPWTRRIMSSTVRNGTRTVCTRILHLGALTGAYAVALRWTGKADATDASEFGSGFHGTDGIGKVQLWTAVPNQTPATEEAQVRGRPDAMIGGALVVDCVRASDAAALRARLAAIDCRKMLGLDHPPDVGTYAFVCFLESAG